MPQAEIFGEYILLERISFGGMAEIYAAKKRNSPKIFVIKRILPAMASDEAFIKMFTDEATIAGELSHRNICQIYELGCSRDRHFISMEYVWGKDVLQLQARLRRLGRTMPPELLVYVGSEVCKGLDYAHKKTDESGQSLEIIHRDVSPQNILISYDGDIRLIDFGIASAKHRSSKTQAGVIKGKFGYMAPEQVRGKTLDRRADVFSLGITLWEMATGKRLFVADNDFAVLDMVKRAKIVKPSIHNPDIPATLEHIIMKALSRDRDKRYAWADDLRKDLIEAAAMTADETGHLLRDIFGPERRRERRALEIYRESQFDDVGRTSSRDFAGDFTLIPKSIETAPDHVVDEPTIGDNVDPEKWSAGSSQGGDTGVTMSKSLSAEPDSPTMVGTPSAIDNEAVVNHDLGSSSHDSVPQLANRVHVAEDVGDVALREDTHVSIMASLSDQAPPVEKLSSAFPARLPARLRQPGFKWLLASLVTVIIGLLTWAIANQKLISQHNRSVLVVVFKGEEGSEQQVGKVSIDADDYGDVSSEQPLIVDAIKPGAHKVKVVTLANHSPIYDQSITFRPWKTTVIVVRDSNRSIDLSQPQKAVGQRNVSAKSHRIIKLNVFPTNAQVVIDHKLVDDAFQSGAGLYRIPLSPGRTYRLAVTQEHYKPFEKMLSVATVGIESKDVRLESEERQSLRLRSIPKSAQVFVDGILAGRTPLKLKTLRHGRHLISIAKPGYKTWRKDIRIDWGKDMKLVDVRLRRK